MFYFITFHLTASGTATFYRPAKSDGDINPDYWIICYSCIMLCSTVHNYNQCRECVHTVQL